MELQEYITEVKEQLDAADIRRIPDINAMLQLFYRQKLTISECVSQLVTKKIEITNGKTNAAKTRPPKITRKIR